MIIIKAHLENKNINNGSVNVQLNLANQNDYNFKKHAVSNSVPYHVS